MSTQPVALYYRQCANLHDPATDAEAQTPCARFDPARLYLHNELENADADGWTCPSCGSDEYHWIGPA